MTRAYSDKQSEFQTRSTDLTRVVLKIALVMFAVEIAIMLVFGELGLTHANWGHALLDSTILTALASPVILCWIIRPYIRQRDTAADLLRDSQKMEAVGQVTGGVAHDLNNLLHIVTGNLELLHERLNDDELREFAQKSLNSAFRGAQLTQQLLAYSRQQVLAPTAINIGDCVADMAAMMRRTLGETIEITVTASDKSWDCKVDSGQFEKAVLNLVANARDAMPNAGKLTIETRNIHIDSSRAALHDDIRPGDYVLVSVADTGIGIPEDAIERAFEPFYTTRKVGEGSGLGLSMVYGFTKQSDGYVTMESAEDAGTTVNLYFPRSAQTA